MNTIRQLEVFIRDALSIDGAHHKQWFLEEILAALTSRDRLEELRNEDDWDRGIPP